MPALARLFGTIIPDVVPGPRIVSLIRSTTGGGLPAIGLAGMDRLAKASVIAMSGRAVGAAGDLHGPVPDWTGTLTPSSRKAKAPVPAPAAGCLG